MKRQGQIVAATIKNFNAAEKALQNMADSAGSAEAELATYQESSEYLYNKFKETFTGIAQNAVERDNLKDLIKFGTSMLELVDSIVGKIGLIPSILSTIVGITASKSFANSNLLGYNNLSGKMTVLGADVGYGWGARVKDMRENLKVFKQLRLEWQNGAVTQNTLDRALLSTDNDLVVFARSVQRGEKQTEAMTAAARNLGVKLNEVSIKSKLAANGVKLLRTALSMVSTMIVTALISKIFEAFNNVINRVDKLNDAADEFGETAKTLESKIKDVNDELSTTKLRIAELNKIENPTIIQQQELDKLIQTNDELERTLKILQAQHKEAAVNAAESAYEWYENLTFDSFDTKFQGTPQGIGAAFFNTLFHLDKAIAGTKADIEKKGFHSMSSAIKEYAILQDEIRKTEEERAKTNDTDELLEYDKILKKLNEDLEENERIVLNNLPVWESKMGLLNTDIPEQKEAYDKLNDILQIWYQFKKEDKVDLAVLVDNQAYAVVKQKLIDLSKQGELTAEKFAELTENDVEGIEAFKKALKDNGYTDFVEIIRAINEYFAETEKNANNGVDGVENLAEAFEKLKETLDDVIDKQAKLAEAFEKTGFGATLSAKEIVDLLDEMPELAKYIKRSGDGYTIAEEGFSAVNAANEEKIRKNILEQRENIAKQIQETRANIELLEKRDELEKKRNELEKEMSSSNGSMEAFRRWDSADVEYQKAAEACKKIIGSVEDLESTIEDLQLDDKRLKIAQEALNDAFRESTAITERLNAAYDNMKFEISDYNKDIKTINDAIKKLNDGTLLTYDEMTALVELSSELHFDYDEQNDRYTVSVEALEALKEQSYETRKQYIDDRIAEARAELEAAKATKEASQSRIDEIDKIADASEKMAAAAEKMREMNNVYTATVEIEGLEDTIRKLEALGGVLTDDSSDNGKSLSDKIQNEIDYYKNILSAVEIVRDKYNEALENEKDYLEEVKDSLKEANDERQREIDLKEAANNLENAKKRKIWVYNDRDGFKQVADDGAVKEAEEKYRDVITDIQEAEIDKQIDAIEKAQDELEKQVKDLTELEQNIENTNTVEQAKTALGLADEKDLLNLSDAVKEGIKNGLAEAIVAKSNEENKDKIGADGNSLYTPVSFEDVLKNMGVTASAEVVKEMIPTAEIYNSAVKDFADALKSQANDLVDKASVINNNGNTVINNSFVINGAYDEEKVANTVLGKLTETFTKLGNSVK